MLGIIHISIYFHMSYKSLATRKVNVYSSSLMTANQFKVNSSQLFPGRKSTYLGTPCQSYTTV